MAEGLGCRGVTVRRLDELKEAIADAARRDEAVVLDITAGWETPILPRRRMVQEPQREERDSEGTSRRQGTGGDGEQV